MRKCRRPVEAIATLLCGLSSALLAGAGGPPAAAARPLVPAEERYLPYKGQLPACDDPAVFERIRSRFYARESEFWKSGLAIAGFDHVREIGFRSNGLDYIPRRYCMARAYMNDSKLRDVTYSIDEDLGFIGIGFEVEWCVAGLDRLDAFAPGCQVARP